jgi:hypothetical protein
MTHILKHSTAWSERITRGWVWEDLKKGKGALRRRNSGGVWNKNRNQGGNGMWHCNIHTEFCENLSFGSKVKRERQHLSRESRLNMQHISKNSTWNTTRYYFIYIFHMCGYSFKNILLQTHVLPKLNTNHGRETKLIMWINPFSKVS